MDSRHGRQGSLSMHERSLELTLEVEGEVQDVCVCEVLRLSLQDMKRVRSALAWPQRGVASGVHSMPLLCAAQEQTACNRRGPATMQLPCQGRD